MFLVPIAMYLVGSWTRRLSFLIPGYGPRVYGWTGSLLTESLKAVCVNNGIY